MRTCIHISVDMYELYFKLRELGLYFISVDDLAKLLAVSTRSASRILSKMCELGLVVKLGKNTYGLIKF